MADFGRVETCACCGKDTKRPSKFRGQIVGRNCWNALDHVRLMVTMYGRDRAIERAKLDYPRSWGRLVSMVAPEKVPTNA